MADENTIFDSTNEVTVGKLAQVVMGIRDWVNDSTAAKIHTHGNITDEGKVGNTANLSLVTGTEGAVTTADLTTDAPTTSGTSLEFIDSVSQDSKGKIDATKKSVTVDNNLNVSSTNPVQNAPVATAIATKAPIDSPAFTGTPTLVNPPSAGDESNKIATTAFVQNAVEQGMATADALTYKGTIAGGNTGSYGALTPAANKGDVYKVTTAGKIDGVAVEVGDMLICNTDDTVAATSSNYDTIADNYWDFIQTNLDGVVIGPASATDDHIALFDGATGKLIKDSTKSLADFATANHVHGNISNDGKIGSAADLAVVTTTEGAVTTANLTTADPTASGNTLDFIASVSQGSNGKITAMKKSVTVDSTYSASGTNPVNGTAVADAIGTLSASAAGGDGKYIKSISESNGVISATPETMDTAPTANSTKAVTSGGVKTYVDNAVASLDVGVTNVSWNDNSRVLSQTKGGNTTSVMDLGAIIPKPNADDNVLTSASDGTSSWQPMEKSTWGTALTDSQGNPLMDGDDPIMDENAVDLWTTFKGTGFGAERAACDIEGNDIAGTYLKKSDLVEMTSEEVNAVVAILNQ